MSSLISIIVNSLIKAALPQSMSQPKLVYETYTNVIQILTLLVLIGILLASIFLVLCFVGCYYLFAQGYSIYELFGIVIPIMGAFLLLLIAFLKNDISRIKEIITTPEVNTEEKHYHIISSFLEGFKSK